MRCINSKKMLESLISTVRTIDLPLYVSESCPSACTCIWDENVNHIHVSEMWMWAIYMYVRRECEPYTWMWDENVNHIHECEMRMWIIYMYLRWECESYTCMWGENVNHIHVYEMWMWIIYIQAEIWKPKVTGKHNFKSTLCASSIM